MTRLLLLLTFILLSTVSNAKTVRDDVSEVLIKVSTKETKITFPDKVIIGVRKSFQKDFHTDLIDNIVYIKAKRVLNENDNYRFIAKNKSGDKNFIIVVKYSDKPDEVLTIVKAPKKSTSRKARSKDELAPHELVRHVSQALYSPDYAIEKPGMLTPVSVAKDLSLDHIYRGSALSITPIAGYKYQNLYVFALEVVNKRSSIQELENSNLFGRIDAIGVAFQHRFVGAGNNKVSTLYIITSHSNINDVIGV